MAQALSQDTIRATNVCLGMHPNQELHIDQLPQRSKAVCTIQTAKEEVSLYLY